MTKHRVAWVIVLAACSGDDGPASIDAPLIDAAVIDGGDAAPSDASDAAPSDASDAPAIDAGDATPIDAGDATPPSDATDAPIDGANDPTQLVEVLSAAARVNAVVANNHHVAWAVEAVPTGGAYVMVDRVPGVALATPHTSVLTVHPDGSVTYRAMEMLYAPGTGPLEWPLGCAVVADPGTATLGFCPGAVRRWTAQFTADPTFAGNGALAVGTIEGHAVHSDSFTVAVGTSLRRFDAVTGAPRTSFGNGGQVTVPVLIDLLELYPLPGDRVLLVIRDSGPTRVRLIVADADGTVHPTVLVDYQRPILNMGVDDLGRITFFTGVTAGRVYFARFDAVTGAADLGFGGDGFADFADLPAGPGASTGFGAVGPDGHVYVMSRTNTAVRISMTP